MQVVQEIARTKRVTSADEERRIQIARKAAMQAALALKMEMDSAKAEAEAAERAERERIAAEHHRIEEAQRMIEEQREAAFRAREEARQNRLRNTSADPFAPVQLRRGGSGTSGGPPGAANPFAAASSAQRKARRRSAVPDLPFPLPQQEDELAAYDSDEDVHAVHMALATLASEIRATFAPVLYSKDDYDPNDVVEQYARLLRGLTATAADRATATGNRKSADEDLFASLRAGGVSEGDDEVSRIETGMRRLERQLRLLPELRERALDECDEDDSQAAAVEVCVCVCVCRRKDRGRGRAREEGSRLFRRI